MTLGQNIQALRHTAGLSQEGLGEKLGVSRQAISKWEADGAVPEVPAEVKAKENPLRAISDELYAEYDAALAAADFTRAAAAVQKLAGRVNL